MAELDPRTAAEKAREMARYVESFNGQKWGGVDEGPDRQNLAMALDHLQETAAMLASLADRVPAPPEQATPSAETREARDCPFCGYAFDDLDDFCYPQNRERTEWRMMCTAHNGGCGAEVFGNTRDEALAVWNRRIGTTPSAAASIKPDVQGTPTIASTAPERIWLDLGEGVDRHEPGVHFRECHEVTWSEDNATCNGIEYVRAALKEAPGGGT